MMTIEEQKRINEFAKIRIAEQEFQKQKTYERLVPIVDDLYAMFALYAWSKGYNDIAKSGARKCWQDFVAENTEKFIADKIAVLDNQVCGHELKTYFNEKIKNQKEITYYGQK